ncbi:MAG: hypothetical protein WBD27_10520 [Pyrinomonadaceae bacterium]
MRARMALRVSSLAGRRPIVSVAVIEQDDGCGFFHLPIGLKAQDKFALWG